MLNGEKSVLSYKAEQPLDIHKKCIKLEYDKNFYVKLKMLNKAGKKKYGIDCLLYTSPSPRDQA